MNTANFPNFEPHGQIALVTSADVALAACAASLVSGDTLVIDGG